MLIYNNIIIQQQRQIHSVRKIQNLLPLNVMVFLFFLSFYIFLLNFEFSFFLTLFEINFLIFFCSLFPFNYILGKFCIYFEFCVNFPPVERNQLKYKFLSELVDHLFLNSFVDSRFNWIIHYLVAKTNATDIFTRYKLLTQFTLTSDTITWSTPTYIHILNRTIYIIYMNSYVIPNRCLNYKIRTNWKHTRRNCCMICSCKY